MQNNVNGDVMGWLTIDGTQIDYPFAKGEDNEFYLRRDIHKQDLYAGTLFADYRCASDLSNFNTIVFGHNMKNQGLFGDLSKFENAEFFDAHQTGALFLVDGSYHLKIFACMVVESSDAVIYNTENMTAGERIEFMEHVKQNALRYREVGNPGEKGIITLSSCKSGSYDTRVVLLATIVEI